MIRPLGRIWSTAILSVFLMGVVTCSSTRPCRQGTLFLSLRLGAFEGADHVTVAVGVDGGSPRLQLLPLRGMTAGTVEITFPSGYPAGKSVSIGVTLTKNLLPLTSRNVTSVLGPGCTTLEIVFDTADAGIDRTTATGGASGAAGTGGTGAAGDAGTGGAGTGGAPNGGSDAGTDRGCVPTATVESCYDNVDDDCNGLIDCADPACTPIAQCEALDPAQGTIGTAVQGSAACPTAAPNSRTLMGGLTAAGCTGCTCAVGTSTLVCSAEVFAYHNAVSPACAANTGGTATGTVDSTQGCFKPNWADPNVYGLRVGPFQGRPAGACLPGGTASKGAPVWDATTKFCGVARVGGGCAVGSACVPRAVGTAGACVLLDGVRSCPPSAPRQTTWYTGFTDSRTCGACACGGPTGGNCGPMIIAIGNDTSCAEGSIRGYLRDGDRSCFPGMAASSPRLQWSGSPVPPSCAPATAVTGTLTATGAQTLCCK